MAAVQDKNIESTLEKGVTESAGAHDEHAAAAHVKDAKPGRRGRVAPRIVTAIKFVGSLMVLVTLIVLAVQVGQDAKKYEDLTKKYEDLVHDTDMTMPKMARAIRAGDNDQVFTSTVAPFITASTGEVDASVLPCTGHPASASTTMSAAPVATSVAPAGYSLGSLSSSMTATTEDVTTVTIPRTTRTLTTTMTTTPGMVMSSAEAVSASLPSGSSAGSEQITTTTIVQPATVTATLSSVSSAAAELSSYPVESSESASQTAVCNPGSTLTLTATVLVTSLSSPASLTPVTTVSVTSVLTTITSVVSGQKTILVTQTVPKPAVSGFSSADALSGSISSTVAPVLGTSPIGTGAVTTLTLTSTASNNYTISHTGGPGPGATISISGGSEAPKPFAQQGGKSSGTVYCAVMLVAFITLFI